jgi:SAM-dependent methyltransferase
MSEREPAIDTTSSLLTGLEASGERFLPEMQGTIALEHWHRYAVAKDLAAGKVVLDIACGEGYGSAALSEVALHVYGVDVAPEAIAHAQAKYRRPHVEFLNGSCARIPLADRTVDLVVSFETIEHHSEHEAMFIEIKRVLRPGGLLIMSSPNKHEYSERADHANAYHVKELYAEEFQRLIEKYFAHAAILGQRVLYASTILPAARLGEAVHFARDTDASVQRMRGLLRPTYQVAVASDSDVPSLTSSLYEQLGESDPEIRNLQHTLDYAVRRIAGLEAEVTGLKSAIESMLQSHSWRVTRPLRAIANAWRAITGNQGEA